jgi:transposase-like protein
VRDFAGPKGRKESFMKDPGRRKRHRPEEVVAKLRQVDEALAAGKPIAEVARSLGVSAVTLHRWRAEYGAVDRDAVRRLKPYVPISMRHSTSLLGQWADRSLDHGRRRQ